MHGLVLILLKVLMVGVILGVKNDQNGLRIVEGLEKYKEEIKEELGDDVIWSWDFDLKMVFGVRLSIKDVYSKKNRQKIKDFFAYWINQFVNAIRPRMKEFQ